MASNAIDLVGDSSDESRSSRSPSPPPTKPVRPKLRTRRSLAVEEDDNDSSNNSAGLRITLRANRSDTTTTNDTNVGDSRRSRARHQQNSFVPTRDSSDEDGGEEVHEADDDYEDRSVESSVEEDEEDEEEEEEEDLPNRRRSGRARRTVQRTVDYESEDDSEGDFEIRVQPRRGGGADERGGGGGALEHLSRTRRAPLPPKSANSSSRKRKRPASAASSSSKSKGKARKPARQQTTAKESDGEYERAKSSDSSVDEDWLVSDDGEEEEAPDDDEIDENAFIVEKILAREVHTLKEWTRLRANKTTRFLTNASIFLDDEEEEANGNQQEPVDDSGDVVVVVDGPSGEPAQKEEERFLIKWKNLSYIHVSWETEKNLMDVDRNVKSKIQRFHEKEMLGLLTDRMHGDEYFNPEFRDVDRILDIQDKPGDKYTPVDEDDDDDDKPKLKYMLIKWKAQPYDAITWEREDDVHDDAAVKEYEARLARAVQRYKRMTTTKSSKSNARKNPKFRGYSATNTPPFKEGQTFELRDYQLTGVNWMLFNWYQRRNSMLADEMGLGKTVQTVTYVNHLAVVEELAGPYLIVAPLSTLGHWQREFTNWTNLNAVVYHGSADARKAIQDYEFYLTDAELRKEGSSSKARVPKVNGGTCFRFDVLITTYEMCSTPDFARLARVKWQLLAVDEAHRLKNRNSKLSLLIQKNFNYENILLLTGTPLQNNVEELWTLLNFLDPDRFDSMEDFLLDYGELKDVSQVEKLHGELKPFLLRRMKEDVEKSLAPKEETIIEVELTVLQKQYYRAIFEQNTEFLARGMKRSHAPSLMNVLMELRKCCNHPFLIKGMEQREVARIREQKDAPKDELERQATELLVTASGKLILLDKLLPRLKENGHRVLIFSQFKIMLDILQDYLRLRAYRCERIDGNITGNDRQAAIDRFSDPDSQSFIMLLSTRAGGVGINLTSADTVIIYDSDWNPQNDLQAQARCHRIGQKKSVKIYRLLTAKTYELHMFHQASLKLGLDQAVLGSIRDRQQQGAAVSKTKRPNAPMSKDEIENLLKHGAYEMFKEDKDGEAEAASKRFSEESIDQILSRSTTIIHDPKANDDGEEGNGKKSLMSSFSKATFVSSDNPDAQVALDDPDFWTKVIGLQAPEKVEPSPLRKRRCRREVKSYLQEDSGEEETKKKRGRPKKQDAEYEEFVISSDNDDDDDDDDEDGTDQLDDDDFEDNKKTKKQRQAKANLPKLHNYLDRLSDLLTTFGYGRWKEIAATSRFLSQYTHAQIAAFCQELIASLARVAATTFIAGKSAPKMQMTEDRQVLMAAPIPPVPPTPQQLNEWLNLYASRFRFIMTMLADMNLRGVSEVPIVSPNLRLTSHSAKSERDAATKLQQIERLYMLHLIIQQQIGPIEPMIALAKDFHCIKDTTKVAKFILDGVLPPHRSEKRKTTQPPSAAIETPKNADGDAAMVNGSDGVAAVATETTAGEEKTPAAHGAVPASNTNDETTETPLTETEPKAPETTDAQTQDSIPPTTETPTAEKEDTNMEAGGNDEITATAATTGESKANESKDKETKDNVSKDKESKENGGPSHPSAATETVATPTKQLVEPSKPPALSSPAINEQHLRSVLSRLRALPDVGLASSAAPWWISIVDDVLLLLYIYRYGWMKGRVLPSSLAQDNMIFGTRTAGHDPLSWPTVMSLNKRARNLLAAWSNGKRLAQQANAIAQRDRVREQAKAMKLAKAAAKAAAAAAPRMLVPPALPPGMQPLAYRVPERIMSGAVGLTGAQRVPNASSDNDATEREATAKRVRFAKLVHQYGIPNIDACTSDQAILEKWRPFREDPQLGIARYPPSELLRDALDLERYCRIRQDDSPSAPPPPLPVPPQWSIFGTRRGLWGISPPLCRRLVHRIDLFRALRNDVLKVSLRSLVDVVNKVIDELYTNDEHMAQSIPDWWTSPRHDIALLQGIDAYGLDTGVTRLWKKFESENPSGTFPSGTWVETYVGYIVSRVQRILHQARQIQRNQMEGAATTSNQQLQRERERVRERILQGQQNESEERQRFRDIHGMREEDPNFSALPLQRKWSDKRDFERAAFEAAIADKSRQPATAASDVVAPVARRTVSTPTEVSKDREEDDRVNDKNDDEAEEKPRVEKAHSHADATTVIAAAESPRAEATAPKTEPPSDDGEPSPSKRRRVSRRHPPPPPPDAEVIELDDDDDDDEEEKEEKEEEEAKEEEEDKEKERDEVPDEASAEEPTEMETETETAEATTPSMSPDTTESPTPPTTDHISPQKDATVAANDTSVKDDDAASEHIDDVHATTDAASSSSPTRPSSAQKRKRAPRSWEVIVIDDSDDDGDEPAPAKRTTRARRRTRGETLIDGL